MPPSKSRITLCHGFALLALGVFSGGAHAQFSAKELPWPEGETATRPAHTVVIMGPIEGLPVFAWTRHKLPNGQWDVCSSDKLLVQGEKFKVPGQMAEAVLVAAAKGVYRHCNGQVWLREDGAAPRLRADVRGEWHDAASLRRLQVSGQAKPLSWENLSYPHPAGTAAVNTSDLEMNRRGMEEHRQRWPQYQANAQRAQSWYAQHGVSDFVPLAALQQNPFAHDKQVVVTVGVLGAALSPTEVQVHAPRNQRRGTALIQGTRAADWKPNGTYLIAARVQGREKPAADAPVQLQGLAMFACQEFDCRDALLLPGDNGLPRLLQTGVKP